MSIRPDDVYDTGVIQPYGVRAVSPVDRARHTIDPFIRAIRPAGSGMAPGVTIDGALGMMQANPMPLAGGLGVVQANLMPLAGGLGQGISSRDFVVGLGGVALGILAAWGLSKVL